MSISERKEVLDVKNPKIISAIVVGILFLIFLFQNTDVVTLRLYFWRVSMPQIILILAVLLIGFAGGYIVAKLTRKPKRLEPTKQ
jgi:uncharacterized integral membrane protein